MYRLYIVSGDCSTKKDTISSTNKMKEMLATSIRKHQQQQQQQVLVENTKRSNIPQSSEYIFVRSFHKTIN